MHQMETTYLMLVNPLPNDKFLHWSKLKAFADNKIIETEKLKFVFGRVDNIVGKGENAGYQHFLLFPQCFQKASFQGSFKVGIVWERIKGVARLFHCKSVDYFTTYLQTSVLSNKVNITRLLLLSSELVHLCHFSFAETCRSKSDSKEYVL